MYLEHFVQFIENNKHETKAYVETGEQEEKPGSF